MKEKIIDQVLKESSKYRPDWMRAQSPITLLKSWLKFKEYQSPKGMYAQVWPDIRKFILDNDETITTNTFGEKKISDFLAMASDNEKKSIYNFVVDKLSKSGSLKISGKVKEFYMDKIDEFMSYLVNGKRYSQEDKTLFFTALNELHEITSSELSKLRNAINDYEKDPNKQLGKKISFLYEGIVDK
jgi:hypothetical protein